MKWMLDYIGRLIAAYLQKPAAGYEPFTPTDPAALRAHIKPGDILLIEGRNHISGIIKYLTQSTWSHAALYVGPMAGHEAVGGEPCELVKSNLDEGIICVPLSKYFQFHTRICRPIALSSDDCKAVCNYAIKRIGLQYDLKNLIDLARYLVPLPVPQRWRRRMIALGSGDPTRLICSALIAQLSNQWAIQSWPVLRGWVANTRGKRFITSAIAHFIRHVISTSPRILL